MHITVIGTGYVGLVTGTCFAETGNDVTCLDTDETKIARLKKKEIPFFEPSLGELLERNTVEGRLQFSSNVAKAISGAEVCFICVGTPSRDDGSANLEFVMSAVESVAKHARKRAILAVKSTVPVGTHQLVQKSLDAAKRTDIALVSNPEFLREGSAVQDCLIPDRIVIGTDDSSVADVMRELFSSFVRTGRPVLVMDKASAELTKYAANSYLAMRISFINEISMICEAVGADIRKVREGVGTDQRIGTHYLFPSVGFGGSCFPKDVRALVSVSKGNDLAAKLLTATLEVNEAQKSRFVQKVLRYLSPDPSTTRVAVWGLSFKAKTDDIRDSPALAVIDGLLKAGVQVTVYDPVAMQNVKAQYGDRLTYASSAYTALEDVDALCVLTEWNQFRHPDFLKIKQTLKRPLIFDGRNLYDMKTLKDLGFTYVCIGARD